MAEKLPKAIFLMGPTAAGKTDLAVALVERLPVEIISVDSAMIYRGMDVGTAKPEPEVLARAPHRLIDFLDPAQSYSAARFRQDALEAMAEITAAGRIPLLVGGTFLYFRALEQGLSVLPDADPGIRERIEQEASRWGWEAMHRRLAEVDPESARRIHPNDPQRIQRALEVYRLTGEPLTSHWSRAQGETMPYRPVKLAISADRELLRRRIGERFQAMLRGGLVEEVERLYRRGDLSPENPSIRCVGYRQVWSYLAGECDFEAMVERGIVATRQYAKRQHTWLRREEGLHWLDAQDPDRVERALKILESA